MSRNQPAAGGRLLNWLVARAYPSLAPALPPLPRPARGLVCRSPGPCLACGTVADVSAALAGVPLCVPCAREAARQYAADEHDADAAMAEAVRMDPRLTQACETPGCGSLATVHLTDLSGQGQADHMWACAAHSNYPEADRGT